MRYRVHAKITKFIDAPDDATWEDVEELFSLECEGEVEQINERVGDGEKWLERRRVISNDDLPTLLDLKGCMKKP